MILILFALIIIIMIIIFICFKEKYTNDTNDTNNLLVVLYENEDNENCKKLMNSLTKQGYKYKLLGQGDKWEGFGTKIIKCNEFYNTLDDNMIVLQIDARDIIINEDVNKLLTKYKKYYNNKLVISAEADCCVEPLKYYKPGDFIKNGKRNLYTDFNYNKIIKYNSDHVWKESMKEVKHKKVGNINEGMNYLNAGMIIGPVKLFKSMYNDIKLKSHEDDQAIMTDYFMSNPNILELDYNEYLFMNIARGGYKNDITFNGTNYQFNKNNHSPSIIQTPGKNFVVYNNLYSNLYNL